jgi:hypothetical protein
MIQAGAGAVGKLVVRASTEGKVLPENRQELAYCDRAGIGTEGREGTIPGSADNLQVGEGMVGAETQEKIALVIPEPEIVAGAMLLDQAFLQKEGGGLIGGKDRLDPLDLLH